MSTLSIAQFNFQHHDSQTVSTRFCHRKLCRRSRQIITRLYNIFYFPNALILLKFYSEDTAPKNLWKNDVVALSSYLEQQGFCLFVNLYSDYSLHHFHTLFDTGTLRKIEKHVVKSLCNSLVFSTKS